MAKEWTDEEVQAEIAAAVAIVREDRFEGFVRGLLGKPNAGSSENGSDPKSPPRGTPQEGATNPKRKSLWWGDLSESSS